MAGYALLKRCKSQFRKILSIISDNFLNALRSQKYQELNSVIAEIQSYIEDNKFLQEPEGRSLETSLLSSVMVPEAEYQNSYHPNSYHQNSYRRSGYYYWLLMYIIHNTYMESITYVLCMYLFVRCLPSEVEIVSHCPWNHLFLL